MKALANIPCELTILPPDRQDDAKRRYVEALARPAASAS